MGGGLVSCPGAASTGSDFRFVNVPLPAVGQTMACVHDEVAFAPCCICAVHNSGNFLCPYFFMVVVGDRCYIFLIDERLHSTRESSLFRVRMIPALKKKKKKPTGPIFLNI